MRGEHAVAIRVLNVSEMFKANRLHTDNPFPSMQAFKVIITK